MYQCGDCIDEGETRNSTVLCGMKPTWVMSDYFLRRYGVAQIDTSPPPAQIIKED
jgi:hypothetical protein